MELDKLIEIIKENIHTGGVKKRQALKYLLDHPEDVSILSMRKVATRARVSPATMMKMAQELGFSNYNELRVVFQDGVIGTRDYFSGGVRKLQDHKKQKNSSSLISKITQTELENIRNSLSGVETKKIDNCVDKILNADRVFIIGLRVSFSIAHYLYYSLSLIRDSVRIIDCDAGCLADQIIRIRKSDLLIAIGFDPYINFTIKVVDHAKNVGADIISITDSFNSPLVINQKSSLVVSTKSPWVFGSLTSAMIVSQALIANTIIRGGEPILKNILAFEKDIEDFDVFKKQ